MPNELEHLIQGLIRHDGPLSVAAYWNLCLAHPQYGYYMTRDPLGVAGDFTTSPEISQLFGEMIGIWVAEQWHRLGTPAKLHLVEYGPGRGTLMADLVRIGKALPRFLDAVHIHLIETSRALRAKQRDTLGDYTVTWHDDIGTVPDDAPVCIIGNEFLDALPIQQFVHQDKRWYERVIGLDDAGRLSWGLNPTPPPLIPFPQPQSGANVFEYSLARELCVGDMCARVKTQGGAALMIDYGHDISGLGDTFQAVRNHRYVDVLADCGNADLTSHVDFGRLTAIARDTGLSVSIEGQGDFLKRMGIEARAAQLAPKSPAVETGLHRLVDAGEMGNLFRVMEIMA